MRTNYILVDFENVTLKDFPDIKAENVQVLVFFGKSKPTLCCDLVLKVQGLNGRGKFVKVNEQQPEGVDFVIAFSIGQLVKTDPAGFFHIISKDKGFDALVAYMKESKISVFRHDSIGQVPLLKEKVIMSASQRAEAFSLKISNPKTPRPRTIQTLKNSMLTFFGASLSAEELEGVIDSMKAKKLIAVDGNKVTYGLSSEL